MRAVVLGVAAAFIMAGPASAQGVGGTYDVAGKSPDGSRYTGTAQITPSGSTCRIKWQTNGSTSEGICMLANKAFAAFYRTDTEHGLVVYELLPDGSLVGYWTIADKEGAGSERLTPRR